MLKIMNVMSFSDFNLHFRYLPSIRSFVYRMAFLLPSWLMLPFFSNDFYLFLRKCINLTRFGVDHIVCGGVFTFRNCRSQNKKCVSGEGGMFFRICQRLVMDLFMGGGRTSVYSLALRGMEIKQVLLLQSFYQEATVLAHSKILQNSDRTGSTFYRLFSGLDIPRRGW